MLAIDLGDISNILVVNAERSFSRAAEKCFVSQPTLSKATRKIEEQLGITLFDRKSIPLKLTKEGEVVMGYFERIQAIQNELYNYCEDLHRQKRNVFRIGASSYICIHLLAPIITDFQTEFPQISIKLVEVNDYNLREYLEAGVLDCGVTVKDLPLYAETSFVLQYEHLVLAVPKSLPTSQTTRQFALSLASIRSGEFLQPTVPAISISEFRSAPFLFLKPGNDTRDRSEQICRDAGFEPKVVMELDLLTTAYQLAEAGCGITFVRAAHPIMSNDISALDFYKIDHPDTHRPIKVFWRPTKNNRYAQEKFIPFLKNSFS